MEEPPWIEQFERQVAHIARGKDRAYVERVVQMDPTLVLDPGLLPVDGDWSSLSRLGFGRPQPTPDPLFMHTTLPPNWSKLRGPGSDNNHHWILDERGIRRVELYYKPALYDRKGSFEVVDVGRHLASHALYGADNPQLPLEWPLLTADERRQFVASMYGTVARRHPPRDRLLRRLKILEGALQRDIAALVGRDLDAALAREADAVVRYRETELRPLNRRAPQIRARLNARIPRHTQQLFYIAAVLVVAFVALSEFKDGALLWTATFASVCFFFVMAWRLVWKPRVLTWMWRRRRRRMVQDRIRRSFYENIGFRTVYDSEDTAPDGSAA